MIRNALLIVTLAACGVSATAQTSESSRTDRHSFKVLLQSAEKARDENRVEDAIRLFRRALSTEPESEEALWYLGSLLYEKEQYREACEMLRQFVTIRPDAGPAWALLGLGEFQLREYARALNHLQPAMAQGMGNREDLVQMVFYHVAIVLTREERFDDGMEMLLKMEASGPADPRLIEPAGLAGLRLPLLPTELPQDRRELVDLAGHAVLALQTQHYEEAESNFKQLVGMYPNEPGVHFLYGAYLAQLHPNESVAEFDRELEISPSHVLARIRLAEQLITQREFDRALALALRATKLDPRRASAHMLAGEAFIALGKANDGLIELETARQKDPTVSRIHWDLLRAYAAAGRKEDAEREKLEIERLTQAKSFGGGETHDSHQ